MVLEYERRGSRANVALGRRENAAAVKENERTAYAHQSRFKTENGGKVFGRPKLQRVSKEGRESAKAEGGIP